MAFDFAPALIGSGVIDVAHYSQIAPRHWPWENFSPPELASPTSGALLLERDAVARLQAMRTYLGHALRINSAYRDVFDNRRVGGRPASHHRFGRAFDISLHGRDRHAVLAAARAAGFTGFGYYRTFLHVDTARARFWYGKNAQELWNV